MELFVSVLFFLLFLFQFLSGSYANNVEYLNLLMILIVQYWLLIKKSKYLSFETDSLLLLNFSQVFLETTVFPGK